MPQEKNDTPIKTLYAVKAVVNALYPQGLILYGSMDEAIQNHYKLNVPLEVFVYKLERVSRAEVKIDIS